MFSLGKTIRLAAPLGILLAVALGVSANASVILDKYADLLPQTRPGVTPTVNWVQVHYVVSQENGIFTYNYAVDYKSGTGLLHFFGLENIDDTPYTNATNDAGFVNPTYVSNPDWGFNIEWSNPTVNDWVAGQVRNFSFQSYAGPRDIPDTYAYVINGGTGANGYVVGPAAMIPEPASLLALACGIAGIAPALIKRRK